MNHLLDHSLAEAMVSASNEARADLLLNYLAEHGLTNYDENVTQLEHGLQSATLARNSGASRELVIGALLHDLGHLLVDEHAATGDFLDEDLNHEEVAADYLAPYLGPAVLEPIRLHVPAKRYLCTVDPDYYNGLSDASKRSFQVQGGKMSDEEKAEMEKNEFLEEALTLRRWDDGGKVKGLETPTLADFRDDLVAVLEAK
ncbi:MAG: HD domain-containing protein [Planctomycetota bacterium]|nr:MAG: HD domain-containing protein [Planctomycetota bacterium]REJ91511.1 MAG: HD domain-containing protein [Planctomycetota bacterium]REK26943.1 MAG: HD domain-containing protein [Planctomycetota bacterium]REK44380.1 MAG: HD domain-containing protein [Planctomycetota bacterium]